MQHKPEDSSISGNDSSGVRRRLAVTNMLTRQTSLDVSNTSTRRLSGPCTGQIPSRRSSLGSLKNDKTSDQRNSLEVPEDGDSGEEVTETKIIGVEKGVIRRRSFKRRLTKEEIFKRGYGTDKAEYERIVERVLAEKFISSAVEGLTERWKMLGFMHEDCMAMVDKWQQNRQRKIQERKSQDREVLVAIVTVVSLILIFWFWLLAKIIW